MVCVNSLKVQPVKNYPRSDIKNPRPNIPDEGNSINRGDCPDMEPSSDLSELRSEYRQAMRRSRMSHTERPLLSPG